MELDSMNIIQSIMGVFAYAMGLAVVAFIAFVIVLLPCLICQYKMLKQTGKPAWAMFVPIYGQWVYSQVALGENLGWVLLAALVVSIIPVIGSILSAIVCLYVGYKFAESFGLDQTKCVLFALFPCIMLIYLLITKNYKYIGPRENFFNTHLNIR